MAREILFRGKRVDNGEWVYGNFVMDVTELQIRENHIDKPIWANGFIRRYDFESQKVEMYEVERETVGQYTGLTDKNGTKIFEGDIVKIVDFQKGFVIHEEGAFGVAISPCIDWDYLDSEIGGITGCDKQRFCQNDNFISLWELMWNYNQEENSCYVVEVIGNIHEQGVQ